MLKISHAACLCLGPYLVISPQFAVKMCLAAQNRFKKPQKFLFWSPKSSKVIAIGASRNPGQDFLLAINSNLKPYFVPFLRYSELLAKNRKFFLPPLIQCLRLR